MHDQLTIFDIGKCCSTCGAYKPYSEYSKHSGHRDGLQSQCKQCVREYLARWRSDPKNKERQQLNMQRWKAANIDHMRQYRRDNAERRQHKLREWKQANREAVAEMEHRRRDRKRSNGNQERYNRHDIFERDGWICRLCFEPVDPNAVERRLKPTIDHIVRLIDGGADAPENVQLAHWGCNSAHWSGA